MATKLPEWWKQEDGMTFSGRSGGTVTMPRRAVQDSPGMQDLINTGMTSAEREEERKRQEKEAYMKAMRSSVGQTATNMNMYERQARNTPGAMEEAKRNEELGRMTMNDALSLGHRTSRYGDFGTVPDQKGAAEKSGQNGAVSDVPARTRPQTPEEWLNGLNERFAAQNKEKQERDMAAKVMANQQEQEANKVTFAPSGKAYEQGGKVFETPGMDADIPAGTEIGEERNGMKWDGQSWKRIPTGSQLNNVNRLDPAEVERYIKKKSNIISRLEELDKETLVGNKKINRPDWWFPNSGTVEQERQKLEADLKGINAALSGGVAASDEPLQTSFATTEEALASNLPPGTIVTIAGKQFRLD